MGTITINVEDTIEKEFRETVREEKGKKKGKLGEAVTEALLRWTEENQQRKIAERQIRLMEKGFKMGKLGKFRREELYDRKY